LLALYVFSNQYNKLGNYFRLPYEMMYTCADAIPIPFVKNKSQSLFVWYELAFQTWVVQHTNPNFMHLNCPS